MRKSLFQTFSTPPQDLAKKDDDLEKNQRSPARSWTPRQGRMINPRAVRFGAIVFAICLALYSLSLIFQPSSAVASLRSGSSGKDAAGATTECTKSYDGVSPVTQHVVMIDAGSSGSRVHVYEFNNCQETPRLVKETFEMLKPGLSSFEDDPEAAAKSLDPLLEVAVKAVPKDAQSCSPIAVKATAGLRAIGEQKANTILEAVQKRLETAWPFPVVENGVVVMDGADEGVFAWVTANYLLGNIGSPRKVPTAAVFDLGGGSTQIVFQPREDAPAKMAPGDHKFDLSFAGREFELYQHSHLGYGLNAARKQMNQLIAQNWAKQSGGSLKDGDKIVNPCLPPGAEEKDVKVSIMDGSTTLDGHNTVDAKVTMVGPKEGSHLQCRQIAETILNKDQECTMQPCSFNGVHQPSLVDAFPRDSDLYVFSFFYDRTFPLGMPSSFSLDELKDLNQKVCKGKDAYDSFKAIDGAVKELESEPFWCMDLSYMMALLHTGYDIPIHREVRIAKKIDGNELGWCLGASLPLLNSQKGGWKCRMTA